MHRVFTTLAGRFVHFMHLVSLSLVQWGNPLRETLQGDVLRLAMADHYILALFLDDLGAEQFFMRLSTTARIVSIGHHMAEHHS